MSEAAAAKSKRRGSASRRRAREVALQVLYAIDLGLPRPQAQADEVLAASSQPRAESPAPETPARRRPEPAESFDAVAASFEMPPGVSDFARELVQRVRENVALVDRTISSVATNWRITRMAAVDRNILRLGTYELACTDTPTAVVLNEAVDLARRFGSDPSPAFVNGILDAVAREVREPADVRELDA